VGTLPLRLFSHKVPLKSHWLISCSPRTAHGHWTWEWVPELQQNSATWSILTSGFSLTITPWIRLKTSNSNYILSVLIEMRPGRKESCLPFLQVSLYFLWFVSDHVGANSLSRTNTSVSRALHQVNSVPDPHVYCTLLVSLRSMQALDWKKIVNFGPIVDKQLVSWTYDSSNMMMCPTY